MSMDISPNFSPKAQQLIARSKVVAASLNHDSVDSAHMLLVILNSQNYLIEDFINSFGFQNQEVTSFVIAFCNLEKRPKHSNPVNFNENFNTLLDAAFVFSKELKDSYVDVEHLFFCLLNALNGVLFSFFKSHDLDPQMVVETFLILMKADFSLAKEEPPKLQSQKKQNLKPLANQPQKESSLESFGVNLNHLCKHKKIGEIIGKEQEIDRACEILCRKIKNNPILIGDPGVGKTAVVEGLAHRIVKGRVPPALIDKEIYAIDLASMIAGTKYRGQFEQRLKNLINECKDDEKIILFIDETHTIVGAGSAEGALDAANILKPALARGEMKLIGATTFAEFKKNIEKDIALTRRFEPIQVEEPSLEETFQILSGIKKSYESFHDVKYPSNILRKIISFCDLYLPNKRFPDKAIDVIDEAGAKLKIKNTTPPKNIQDIEEELYSMISDDRNQKEQEKLLEEYDYQMNIWQSEPLSKITIDDILTIISNKAKVPKENLVLEKDIKTKNLERNLLKEIVNQNEAVSALTRCVLRSKIGLRDLQKPIGSFLFLGASGVGKTWTAKVLAKNYFGSEKNMLRLDMSEYSEKVSSSKLIGASPGYVGYEEGGILIESMKKKPHCVILFDEIEKAHPQVQQLLLQMLEEGEIEDNNGNKAYFKDSIIILTSNIGSDLTTKESLGFAPAVNSQDEKITDAAKKILSPELVNRLNQIVIFNHLTKSDLAKIFHSEISKLRKKLRSKKVKISFSPEVCDFICEKAEQDKMGARPLKRLIQKNIEDQIVNYYYDKELDKEICFNFILEVNSKIKAESKISYYIE